MEKIADNNKYLKELKIDELKEIDGGRFACDAGRTIKSFLLIASGGAGVQLGIAHWFGSQCG